MNMHGRPPKGARAPRARGPALGTSLALAVVAGCAGGSLRPPAPINPSEIDSALRAIQTQHGPPLDRVDLRKRVGASLRHDINGDGQEEAILLFTDDGIGPLNVKTLDDLRKGVTAAGFAVVTRVDGAPFPVFYYHGARGIHLTFIETDRRRGLLGQVGRPSEHTMWSWQDFRPDWQARWAAEACDWSEAERRLFNWRQFPALLANDGK